MDQPLVEKNLRKDRILVAPLDWGLGHATRCIPIIRELLAQGADVWLAGEGAQKQLLVTEFPELPFLQLPGYRIQYAKTGRGMIWKMILQGPRMRRAIQYEHRWLKKMVAQHQFDAVISDNRYGLSHSSVPCIFITHQLMIKSYAGKWTERALQKSNYRYINKFTACWVPDAEGENNFAGDLSHPQVKPVIPVRYIGLLSRFERKESRVIVCPDKPGRRTEKANHLLVILSGPEPQRTMLEEKIIRDIGHYHGTATIIRGLPGSAALIPSTNMIEFYNHLPTAALNEAARKAEYIISRSGYSTVMDVLVLQKKSILIPTPGQTEQQYLGEYLMKKGIIIAADQQNFSLNNALSEAAKHVYTFPLIIDHDILKKIISNFLHQLSKPSLG